MEGRYESSTGTYLGIACVSVAVHGKSIIGHYLRWHILYARSGGLTDLFAGVASHEPSSSLNLAPYI